MFTINVRKLFRKAFGPWIIAASPRSKPRFTFRPRLEVLENRLVPAIWYVAGLGDTGQGMTNEGDLRYCMNNANAGDTIYFGVSGTIALNGPLPAITKNITIDGAGQNVEIWGGGAFRIFTVNGGVTAEIDNLSIDDGFIGGFGGGLYNAGDLTLKNDTFLSNQATQGGGAIANESGSTLDMENVSINSNSTAGDGGGIINYGDLFCDKNCTIVQNKATNIGSSSGGGIANFGGFVDIGSGQVTGNTAAYVGGGIYQTAGTLSMSGASRTLEIQGNSALAGGGLFVTSGSVTILDGVTIATNKATGWAASDGGGICLVTGSLTIDPGVTISNNKADIWGGGLYLAGNSKVTIDSGTIEGNSATNGSAGGIFFGGKRLIMADEYIYKNTASKNGGGLYVQSGLATVSGASMDSNKATTNGGGIYVSTGILHLKSETVHDNTAGSNGGGMFIKDSILVTVNGGRFYNNIAGNNGGGIYNSAGGVTLSGNVSISVDNSAKQGGGLYLLVGSTTTFSGCTVKGNQATSGQGIGVYQQKNAQGKTANVLYGAGGLTDNDDPGGKPFQGP